MVRRLFAGGEWLRTSRSARDRQRFEAWAALRPIDCRAGGIGFAACQDEATNGVCITRPASQAVAKMDCAEFILVGPLRHIVPIGPRRPVERAREIKALLKSRFQTAMCEVAHTSVEISKVLLTPAPASARERPCHGGVMPRTNRWNQSVPRVELDQRSRAARLRFERIDQLFIVRPAMTHLRLRRLLYLFTVGRYGALPREGGVKELPSDRWPSRLPMLLGIWLENAGVCNLPGDFNF